MKFKPLATTMRGILLVFSALGFRLNRSDLANQQDEYLMSDMLRTMRINKAYLGLFAFCLFELSYGDSLRSLPFGTLSVTVGQDSPAAPSEPPAPADPKPADPKPAEPPAAEPVAGEPKAGEQQADAPPRRDRRRFGPRGGRSEGQEPSAPADKPNEKPAETPAERPAEKAEDKPAEKVAEKPEEKAPPESKDPSVDTRLNAIEMQLGEIAKMLQGLKASNADEKKDSGSKMPKPWAALP